MDKRKRAAAAVMLFLVCHLIGCGSTLKPGTMPETASEERIIRIGCLVSEEYYFYREQIYHMAEELQTLQLIAGLEEQKTFGTAEEAWQLLTDCRPQGRLFFEESAFYRYDVMTEEEKNAFGKDNNLDLLLVFGTAAGVWLTENAEGLSCEYMVFGSADPVAAGIVMSNTERCNDKSFVHVDNGRTGRQIDFAYELFSFQTVGVVYEDSDAAYSYSGIQPLEERAGQYGFHIYRLHVEEPQNMADYGRYYRELKEAYAEMIGKVELLYITTGMIEDAKLPWLLEEVHKNGIITVAETSESQVAYGAMLHITMSDPEEEGQFAARTLSSYAGGTDITQLNQIFEITPKISINQATVAELKAEIPMSVYLVADNIYGREAVE